MDRFVDSCLLHRLMPTPVLVADYRRILDEFDRLIPRKTLLFLYAAKLWTWKGPHKYFAAFRSLTSVFRG